MKRCGLYIRVSTDRQAKVEEGSLKNQDQLLIQHVEIKNKISPESWLVMDRRVDKGRFMKTVTPPATGGLALAASSELVKPVPQSACGSTFRALS